MKALNLKFQQIGIPETNLSIDEQMVPYLGRHRSKMFIRNKPICFGFKLWCSCSSTLLREVQFLGSKSRSWWKRCRRASGCYSQTGRTRSILRQFLHITFPSLTSPCDENLCYGNSPRTTTTKVYSGTYGEICKRNL